MSLESALAEVLPAHALITELEARRPYECDGLSAYRQVPRVVAIPETRDQVRAVLRVCHAHGVPVVPRGAATGLSGGALPAADGCLLSLARFNRILEIDPVDHVAVVEPGVRNLAISEAAARHGLYYAPDPSSQIACTIGGNVAENAGGVHCLKYGLTVHNVLEVELLTSDGEWLTLGGRALDAPGYDLLALVHGSEGLLGIVMTITVKLLPLPEAATVLLAAFGTVEEAARAVAAVIGAGVIPAGLEMMDGLAIRAAEAFCKAGYPVDAAAMLLCELDGAEDEVRAEVARVAELLRAAGAREVRTSRDAAERQLFWRGRKAAFPAMGRIAPDYLCMDGTIPRGRLAEVLTQIAALSRDYGLPIANVFHAGDGNLHPLIAFDANDDEQTRTAKQIGARILEICLAAGGTITGEHGVGVEKIDQMCLQFGATELDYFRAIKRIFDPAGRLNPGKAVPELRRCEEFQALRLDCVAPRVADTPDC